MAVTRSMSGTLKRDKVTSDKSNAQRDAEVTNSKSGASQEVDAHNNTDKYYDLDERILAFGIFMADWKEERLKNDPDVRFTRESYQAAMRDYNSLSDSRKDLYIAEAKKRNSVENNAVPVRPGRKSAKQKKSAKPKKSGNPKK